MKHTLPLLFPSVYGMEERFFFEIQGTVEGFYLALICTASDLLWHNYLYMGDPTPGQPQADTNQQLE